MIALIASALLGLYVLLPVIIFDRALSWFVPAKKINRSRTEEFVSGAVVILIPFILALTLSHLFWYVGHHPFPLNEDAEISNAADYQTAFMALESDKYLTDHEVAVWKAAEHIKLRQFRFLSWTYGILLVECIAFVVIVNNYGRWQKHTWYRVFASFVIGRVSTWHLLFSDFSFEPGQKRTVWVDVITRGDALYRGTIGEAKYLVDHDGALAGLLLAETERFARAKLEDDRKLLKAKDMSEYWIPIKGKGQFYIPASEISNINIRHVVSEEDLTIRLNKMVQHNINISRALTRDAIAQIQITINKRPKVEPTASSSDTDATLPEKSE